MIKPIARSTLISKAKFLYTIVILAFMTLVVQAISGFVMWLVLPRGGGGGGGLVSGGIESTFIWNRNTWLDIHNWTAVAFLILITILFYMHRKWIYKQTKSLFGKS